MNYFQTISNTLRSEIESLIAEGSLAEGLDLSRVGVEQTKDPAHGDLASNVAMVLAKAAKTNPRELGQLLADRLAARQEFESVEVAGPGFINMRLVPGFWTGLLPDVLRAGTSYGDCDLGKGETINVEYVSANPTGPMHIGHARGAVIGDALATLLAKAGHKVTREYYINDAGAQVDVLARSAYLRYREALGEDIGEIPDGLYPGNYLKKTGVDLANRDGKKWLDTSEEDWLPVFREFAIDSMMDLIRDDLAALGVSHDVFSSERSLVGSGVNDEVVSELESRDLVYMGTLEPPKGKRPDDWEERPQLLFRSTNFDDDVDRPLKKGDGDWTYFASDIGYHRDKFRRGFANMIDVWGADHKGYVKRMQSAVKAITEDSGELDVRLCNLVNLLEDGKPAKMSKRAGSFVTLREVVDEVGKEAVRFMMLTRNSDVSLDFDLKKVTEQSKDNPVFYVQYAHARICSVLRNAAEEFPNLSLDDSSLTGADVADLQDPGELAMIKELASWPQVVENAATAHEPHRIAFYLSDLASSFHAFWNRGNAEEALRFIVPGDAPKTLGRLALARSVAIVIASGLAVMGVEPVEEMR
ncbi:MAG: arginine--tRNA ligase [Rhodospirillaceae bacterium]|nr:arginine--tRNA ligase [Rhodospirillaceae bacterium]|tara:strand:+ start:21044 stop:22798 length:1755 start_codon:yes stop_codon:yes gene_type:complete